MPQAPPVLRRLKALGLRQKDIAAKLGASPQAVSAWFTGKNPFEEPWHTDAHLLLAVLVEHLAQGEPAGTVAFGPRAFMNTGGITHTGEFSIPEEEKPAFDKLNASRQDHSPEEHIAMLEKFHARHLSAQIAASLDHAHDSWAPAAHELNAILRMVDSLRLQVMHLLRSKARPIMTEEGDPDADKTS